MPNFKPEYDVTNHGVEKRCLQPALNSDKLVQLAPASHWHLGGPQAREVDETPRKG